MSTYKSQKSSEGNFSGYISLSVSTEIHKSLFKEATYNNMSISALIRKILHDRTALRNRRIWVSDEYVKRNDYTILFFKNNMDSKEICVQLCGQYQGTEDIVDSDHKFSNYINHNMDFNEQMLYVCEFVLNEKNEKELKQYGV